MLELKDVMTLLNAGYTKADIEAMIAPAPIVKEEAPEAPATLTEKPQEAPKAEPVADNTNEVFTALSAEIKALNEEVKNLRGQLQRDALLMDGMKTDTQDDAVKILASIINPPEKTK